MAVIRLSGQLQVLAGGAVHETRADTVLDALRELEVTVPATAGWVLDERRTIRRHINVFVDGERGREDTPVGADSRIYVLPSITGGRT